MEHWLSQYGAIGVFLGAAFEGQTAVILGGLLARQHILPVWVNLVAATLGSGAIDHLLFVMGRRFRSHRWVEKTASKPAFAKALGFIERYPVGYILAFRFLYGLRLASPVAIGVSRTSAWLFGVMNMVAAGLWAFAFTAVGYGAGDVLRRLFGKRGAGPWTLAAVGAVLAVVAAVWLTKWLKGRRARASELAAAEAEALEAQPADVEPAS